MSNIRMDLLLVKSNAMILKGVPDLNDVWLLQWGVQGWNQKAIPNTA